MSTVSFIHNLVYGDRATLRFSRAERAQLKGVLQSLEKRKYDQDRTKAVIKELLDAKPCGCSMSECGSERCPMDRYREARYKAEAYLDELK